MNSAPSLAAIAWRIFKRDWKRGELLVLLFSMGMAMASVSVIYLIIDRIEGATASEVSDLLGADLVITSPKEIAPEWLQQAKDFKLESARSIEFSSVLFFDDRLQLSAIKAISDNYPLKGALTIASTPYGTPRAVSGKPENGKIWVEPRIFTALKLNVGNQVELGYANLEVAAVLMRQPGQGSTLFNVAPTTIMNIENIEATKIIQPGSLVSYRYLFSGEKENIARFAAAIENEIDSSQRLISILDDSPMAGSALTRSKKYIGLSSLLTLILLGVAIAMSANRYARKQFDMSALMRCFGMSSGEVLRIFIYILGYVGIAGIVSGSVVGVVFQYFLVAVLADLVTTAMPAADYSVLIMPMLAASILLFGFSLPALLKVKLVPPMRVLRRQLQPLSMGGWLVYLVSAFALLLVMWLQMGDLTLLISVLLGLFAVVCVFTLIAALVLRSLKQLIHGRYAAVNFSLRQLQANKSFTLLHLLAFSITLFVISLIILVRTELVGKWQQSLGEKVPNHFMVNVKPAEVSELKDFFADNQLEFAGLYPMIRGRIAAINGVDIKTAVSEEARQHNSLRRELNITWASALPAGNKLVEGEWEWPQQSQEPLISIEERTASALDLSLGDRLEFSIGAEKWSARIVSIRSIDWQTFTPNFYVIANPGALEQFNATYITSFYMPKPQKALLAQLVENYPAITVIELDLILEEIQAVINKVATAVELIMVFVVAAGIALLWATMEHSFAAKYKQSAILRTLGASRGFIARSFRFEYFWLAILSSMLAIAAVEVITFLLYSRVFEIDFVIHWQLWWILPITTLVLMLVASWRGVDRVTRPSPLDLLRQN